MTRRRIVAVVLLLVPSVAPACQQGYRFHTVARYRAPAGRYEVRIRAEGTVPAGADLSDVAHGVVEITPTEGSPGSSVRFEASRPESINDEGLAAALRRGGYASPPAEFDEVQRAIEGALCGPKGTFMEGQTQMVQVLETTFGH